MLPCTACASGHRPRSSRSRLPCLEMVADDQGAQRQGPSHQSAVLSFASSRASHRADLVDDRRRRGSPSSTQSSETPRRHARANNGLAAANCRPAARRRRHSGGIAPARRQPGRARSRARHAATPRRRGQAATQRPTNHKVACILGTDVPYSSCLGTAESLRRDPRSAP